METSDHHWTEAVDRGRTETGDHGRTETSDHGWTETGEHGRKEPDNRENNQLTDIHIIMLMITTQRLCCQILRYESQ